MGSATLAPPAPSSSTTEDDGLGPDPTMADTNLEPGAQAEQNGTGDLPEDAGTPPTPPADLPTGDGGGDEDDHEDAPRLFLLGDRELGLKVGGRTPDSSKLKLKGKAVELGGQFNRGDRIITVATLQVTEDQDADTIDTESGIVKSTAKTQKASLCGIATIGDFLALKLEGQPELLAAVRSALDLDEE